MVYLLSAAERSKEIACLDAQNHPFPERLAKELFSRGGFYLSAGERAKAISDFERAVKLYPPLKPEIDKRLERTGGPTQ